MYPKLRLLGLALTVGTTIFNPVAVRAASDEQLSAIQRQIEALKNDYQARIGALELRLRQAESDAAAARAETARAAAVPPTATTAATPQAASPPAPNTPPAAANAFNPAISAVLNGTFGQYSRDPSTTKVPGFLLGGEAGLGKRGFSLGESEVSFSANVDQALYGNLTLSIDGENQVGVEEAYLQTTSLPWGLTAKAGRFFSGIGYLNEKHAHDWSFIDAPLPYRAFLNKQYGDDGIQVRWLAPTDFFLEFGGEAFRGDSFPAGNASNRGKGAGSLFAHTGGDIGINSSWLAGLSYLDTKANNRVNGDDTFRGRDNLGIASLVYKWAPDGNPIERNLTLSGEYFLGRENGTLNGVSFDTGRTGWYVQGVYQFMPRWRVGLRHDEVRADDVVGALKGTTIDNLGHTPRSNSALLEFDTSEFGRFRAQYSRDESNATTDNIILGQYTIVFGPHGAHRF